MLLCRLWKFDVTRSYAYILSRSGRKRFDAITATQFAYRYDNHIDNIISRRNPMPDHPDNQIGKFNVKDAVGAVGGTQEASRASDSPIVEVLIHAMMKPSVSYMIS